MIEPPKLVESKYRAIYPKTRLENTTTSHSSSRKSSSDLSLQKSPETKICLSPNTGYKASPTGHRLEQGVKQTRPSDRSSFLN